MPIASRQELAEYCLRTLGAPVLNIEVADEQLSDAIENSIQFFQEYHPDGTTRDYVKHQITQTDKDNGWIPVDENIMGIVRVLPWTPSFADGLFDITYQLRMNDLRNLSSGTLNYFVSTMEYLALMDQMLRKEKQFRFNRRMNRLYLDIAWNQDISIGQHVVVEVHRGIDDETYTEVFNDPWLKKYAAAWVKRYWGANLRKYKDVSLPGGITIDGGAIYEEANNEISFLEEDLIRNQAPLGFYVG